MVAGIITPLRAVGPSSVPAGRREDGGMNWGLAPGTELSQGGAKVARKQETIRKAPRFSKALNLFELIRIDLFI